MMNEKCRKTLAGLKSIKDAGILKDAEQVNALTEAIKEYENLCQDTEFDEIPVVLRVVVYEWDITNILMYAVDGGIGCWCDDVRVEGELLGEDVGEQIAKGGTVILHDKKENVDVVLTKEKVLQGIRMYAEQPVYDDVFEIIDHKLQFARGDMDAFIADAIIQYAVFSDIVYAE